jgi:hypothetical protein
MDSLEMTGAAGHVKQADIAEHRSSAETYEDSSAVAPATDRPLHRQERRAAGFGLVLLSVVIGVLGGVGGYYGSQLMSPQYAARAEIQYRLAGAEPNDVIREDRKLGTQVVLMRSRAVLAEVAVQNGMTPDALADKLSAKLVENSEIIDVELRDRTPERAQELLTAVIDSYLAVSNANWHDPVIAYVQFQLAAVQSRLQAPGISPEDATRLTGIAQFLGDLLGHLEQGPPDGVESWPVPPAEVLTDPYPVATQVSPRPILAAAAGAATAAVVAAVVVLLVVRRRQRS